MKEQAIVEFKRYEDQYGLIQPTPGKSSGNGLLYTSEMLVNLLKNRLLNEADAVYYLANILACQEEPGLYKRHPTHADQEGIDDYIGITAAFYLLGFKSKALDIYEYGVKHKFIYANNKLKNKSSWFFRFPHFVCHLKWAAGLDAGPVLTALWCIERAWTILTLRKHNQDAFLLGYMLGVVAKGRSSLVDFLLRKFEDKLFKFYPGGYAEVAAEYFGDKEHPLVKYWAFSIEDHFVIHDR